MEIEFCAFERPESRFASLEELKHRWIEIFYLVWSIFGRSSEVVYEEREEKPSFRTKLIFLTLSACIISTLILGIAQMVLSVFIFETGSF